MCIDRKHCLLIESETDVALLGPAALRSVSAAAHARSPHLSLQCFMNSILQCLSNTQSLRDYCLHNSHRRDLNNNNRTNTALMEGEASRFLTHHPCTHTHTQTIQVSLFVSVCLPSLTVAIYCLLSSQNLPSSSRPFGRPQVARRSAPPSSKLRFKDMRHDLWAISKSTGCLMTIILFSPIQILTFTDSLYFEYTYCVCHSLKTYSYHVRF